MPFGVSVINHYRQGGMPILLLTNLHIGEEWGYMYLPLIRQYIFDGSKVNNLNAARLITLTPQG